MDGRKQLSKVGSRAQVNLITDFFHSQIGGGEQLNGVFTNYFLSKAIGRFVDGFFDAAIQQRFTDAAKRCIFCNGQVGILMQQHHELIQYCIFLIHRGCLQDFFKQTQQMIEMANGCSMHGFILG